MINKRIILVLTFSLFSLVGYSQPGNGNGPPNPPPTFCQIHPNHPNCVNAIQVPLSDWYWEIGLMLTFSGFVYFKFFRKSINLNQEL